MKSWGDVNRVLNGMVREGRISSFRSNAAEARQTGSLEIAIVPADGGDKESARREAVRELARLGITAQVHAE
ncbi:MAG: hypothetical protein ACFE0R_16635 [Salinarimonas sp.]